MIAAALAVLAQTGGQPTGPDRTTLILVALIAAIPVAYTAWATRRAADRSRVIEKTKVDADAYDRARKLDESTITRLERDLDSAQRSIDALRRDLSDEQRENLRLREHIDRLEATVARLRARLGVAGLLDERKSDKPEEGR